ncbi:MAG: NAD(P)/FAD-dependent oxidoreductase [Eubacterium sp.]|nr:NAD(P)/FAD-dependent oxidoreductase [Eubacterium sp.]
MNKVIIVGGGAAGMMAAIAAADSGAKVCLIEKNEKLGKKLFITGKGRCNVTNAADMDALFQNVCTNRKFLYSAFYGYDNQAVMAFLERAGCSLKTERGGRVFPVSDHSSDVIAALQRELKKRGVEILLNTEVSHIWTESQEGVAIKDSDELSQYEEKMIFRGVRLKDGRSIRGDRGILCTGGVSYPSTGSTGDGHRIAKETGHKVTELAPALVPFNIEEKWCGQLMGLSLRNVAVTMSVGKKNLYEGFGEMLFTHFGVSGPLILSASSHYHGEKDAKLYIDLKPALDEEQLDRRILRDFEENKNKQFKNSLGKLFPVKLIPVMMELSGISPEKKVNEITREERRNFGRLIKHLPLTVAGTRGFEEAIITRGGVSVKEIDPSTMGSKKVDGLYFAGELLDLDALTGGFNLQIAWSTGHLAGISAAGS